MDEANFFNDLIGAVRDEPAIYVKNHPHYIYKVERQKAWQRIAARTAKTTDECEKRWKLLREKFGRILHNDIAASGSGADQETTWPFFKHMTFLRDHCRKRTTRCNAENEPEVRLNDSIVSDDSIDPLLSPNIAEPSSKKKKVDHKEVVVGLKNALSAITNKIESRDSCEDELFARNITSMLKPFSVQHKDLLKSRIFNFIMEERHQLY